MKRTVALAAVLLALSACGSDEASAPTPGPTATHEITGRIMGPADKARDVSDQLEDRYSE